MGFRTRQAQGGEAAPPFSAGFLCGWWHPERKISTSFSTGGQQPHVQRSPGSSSSSSSICLSSLQSLWLLVNSTL